MGNERICSTLLSLELVDLMSAIMRQSSLSEGLDVPSPGWVWLGLLFSVFVCFTFLSFLCICMFSLLTHARTFGRVCVLSGVYTGNCGAIVVAVWILFFFTFSCAFSFSVWVSHLFYDQVHVSSF